MKFGFTISTANYLAQAKVAGLSLLTHNPDYYFTIYLADKINGRFNVDEFLPIQVVEVESLGIEQFEEMLQRYNAFELSNALKPFVAEYIFNQNKDVDSVAYIDSDIMVYAPFAEIGGLLVSHNIIITPHLQSPLPLDGFLLDEQSFLNAGIYNGGFFIVKRGAESFRFLKWWMKRLRNDCIVNFHKGLFVDQIWLNLVPLYFENVHVLRHPGYNVAFWNLHERTVSLRNHHQFVNDGYPLVFFHFSGYDFDAPGDISRYQTRYSFVNRPDVAHLFNAYYRTVVDNGYHRFVTLPWHYNNAVQFPMTKKRRSEDFVHKLAGILKQLFN